MFVKRFLLWALLLGTVGAHAQKSKPKVLAPATAYAWISGVNFMPSTAINQLEMWQAATFATPSGS